MGTYTLICNASTRVGVYGDPASPATGVELVTSTAEGTTVALGFPDVPANVVGFRVTSLQALNICMATNVDGDHQINIQIGYSKSIKVTEGGKGPGTHLDAIKYLYGITTENASTPMQWRTFGAGAVFNRQMADNGISISALATHPTQGHNAVVRTNHSAEKPYMVLNTEPVRVSAQDLSPAAEKQIYKGFVQRFSWSTAYDGTNVFGGVSQASARFFYRGAGETVYKYKQINGNRNYIDFDTTEISADSGMDWYIEITSNSGVIDSSDVVSNVFRQTTVRLTSLSPSSSSKTYKGFAITFRWALNYSVPTGVSGALSQRSAILRWRKKDTTETTSYAITSAAVEYTLGGSILPVGGIEWQVEVINTSGSSTMSDWISFTNIELPIVPADLYPAEGGKILKGEINRFGWSIEVDGADKAPGEIVQTSAVLRYRPLGQSDTIEIQIDGAQSYYDMPAGSITADDIEWQVQVTASTGTSGTSDWVHVNTQDALSTPACIFPVGVVIDDTAGITFVWQHIISTGTAQTAYELQYSTNLGSSYTTLATAQNGDTRYDTAPGMFPQGTLMWRVRTKNGDGVWGGYSAAATIIIRRAPSAPIITYTDAKPRPTVRWQSEDQQGVRIQVGEHDTGWLHSTAKEYQMPYILPDGIYRVALAIKTIFGIESAPAVTTVTIKNVPGPDLKAEVKARLNAVYVNWVKMPEYTEYYVLRDGVPIARTPGGSYADALSVGKHVYAVQGMTADGYYGQSDDLHAYLQISNAVISAVDKIDWLPLRLRRGERPAHHESRTPDIELAYYAGRTRPEAYVSPMLEASHELTFSVRTRGDYARLKALQGRMVVYKDCWDDLIVGILGEVTAQLQRAIDVTFVITETDFVEAVRYG